MTDLERDKLQLLLDDEILMGILKRFFKETIEAYIIETRGVPNEIVGQEYKALEAAHSVINQAFKRLESEKVEQRQKQIQQRNR